MRAHCAAKAAGSVADYPVRKQKKARKIEYYTVYILQCGDEIALQKRPAKGLLAGQWALPQLTGTRDAQAALTAAEQWHTGAAELVSVRRRVHIFTHIEWHMTCVHLLVTQKPDCFTWITDAQLQTETALPTAFRICLPE
jgi:A/G-specific adenine glycosylase